MKKLIALTMLALFLLAVTSTSIASVPKQFTAQGTQTWSDPADSQFVDVKSVTISQDDSFLHLSFTTYSSLHNILPDLAFAAFLLDTDQDPTTGDTGEFSQVGLGPDFAVIINHGNSTTTTGPLEARLYKVLAPDQYVSLTTLPWSLSESGDAIAVAVPLSYLPNYDGINWLFATRFNGYTRSYSDYVPNQSHYTYTILSATNTPTSTSTTDLTQAAPTTPTQPVTTQTPATFSDVPATAWYKAYVDALVANGIISGYSDNTFRPLNNITRAEFAKMIILAIGESPATSTASSFTDVTTSYWAKGYIERAKELGVINGYPEGTFKPTANVSRQEIAKMVVLAKKLSPATSYRADFTDVPSTLWSWSYILAAKDAGIISGYPDQTFKPVSPATRAETCKMVQALPN